MRNLILFICSAFWLLACSNAGPATLTGKPDSLPAAGSQEYQWIKIADSAGWRKSYNFQMFSLRDTLWTLHPDGAWYSADGESWAKSSLSNIINNQAFLDYVLFNQSMYGLGHFEGNIEQFQFKPEIYRSSDMRQWQTLSQTGNLPPRFFYHPFVFQNKIWIIGGEDRQRKYADIWSSADGIGWVKQKDSLPFGSRSSSRVVELKGKLFLLNNDVWSSTDALNWQQESAEIVKGITVFGYAALVYDEKIWLLGCNRNGQFSSQVLYSANGKTWEELSAPWTPRGGIAAVVFKGKIFMTGGKYGGTPNQPEFRYSNDLWVLEKKR